jgi:predicted transcriptional regulator
MKNRSRSEIYRSILETANADEGTNRTKLMYKSYLSFSQLKEYLGSLQENGLIDKGLANSKSKSIVTILRL